MQFLFMSMYLLHIHSYSNCTALRVLLPTLQTKAINHIGFNDNVNIWDTWEFTTLIMADRDTVTSVCVTMYFSYLPCQIEDPTDSFQISEQHQSSPPVSNTSCGYRELTLLYCLVLSLPSNFEQREISGPSESDKSKQLYSESGNNSKSSTSDDFNDFND